TVSVRSHFSSKQCFLPDEVSAISANPDERVVDLQGEAPKVLKALEAVVGHLRKFLVDRSVLPLFEKTNNVAATQEHQVETWADKPMMRSGSQHGIGGDYSLPVRRETLFLDREPQRESQFSSHGLSLYGRDPGLPTTRSPALGRTGGPIVTQIAQTMQIPLVYAEDIIGVGGTNIAYIRRTSGAILTVQESRGLPDEITVEIKGTSSQVQTAQQLIQECVNGHKESIPSSYGKMDSGLRSSYSQMGGNSSYQSSSAYGGQSYGGGYGGSGLGGYSSYRM
ncbi:RNA-binding KH domain-containing protein PEPPER-like, partial [Cynara cardunculus var. scolymus]|uniref:RNA-binding KH domain-containing protein PEPPER-like n=1 Tax=Cynara cardunculus var. scolymus TaxID=59895 RepID=UPI000D6294B2